MNAAQHCEPLRAELMLLELPQAVLQCPDCCAAAVLPQQALSEGEL